MAYTENKTPAGEKNENKKQPGNFVARLCALLLAIILWFYVIRVENPTFERVFDYIPINISGVEEMLTVNGFSVISGYDGVVSVTLAGKQSDINRMKNSDVIATVDVSAVSIPGEHILPVSITTKGGYKVLAYEPTTLEVYVDTTLQRNVECIPQISYSKEENFVLGEAVVSPGTVKISGPATIVEKVHRAVTEVDFGKVSKSMEAVGSIKLVDEAGNEITNPYLKTNTNSVKVSLPVYKQKFLTPSVRFSDQSIPAEYFTVNFEPDILSVYGEASYIDAMSDKLVVGTVDPREITDVSTFEILLSSVNDDVEFADYDTIRVEVTLDPEIRGIKKTIPVYLSETDVKIVGGKEGATYDIKSKGILYIELRSAEKQELEQISAQDISLSIDLSTVGEPGEYKRDVTVSTNNPKIFASGKYSLTVGVEFE
ncbi:MAG: hypothetical protein IJO74_04570 [Clostridia bacterium]|nr:hypothetical protein [Clostridia bacterium]